MDKVSLSWHSRSTFFLKKLFSVYIFLHVLPFLRQVHSSYIFQCALQKNGLLKVLFFIFAQLVWKPSHRLSNQMSSILHRENICDTAKSVFVQYRLVSMFYVGKNNAKHTRSSFIGHCIWSQSNCVTWLPSFHRIRESRFVTNYETLTTNWTTKCLFTGLCSWLFLLSLLFLFK